MPSLRADLHSAWPRSDQLERSIIKVRRIIGIAATAVWLTSTALSQTKAGLIKHPLIIQSGLAIANGQKTTLSQSEIGQSQRAKTFAVEGAASPPAAPTRALRTQPQRSQDNLVAIQEEKSRSQTSTGFYRTVTKKGKSAS